MSIVTLQTTYDPILSCVYPKVTCPLEISSGSEIYSDVVSHLAALSTDQSTASMLFTVTSSPGHVNHVTTIMTRLSFSELRNRYAPCWASFGQLTYLLQNARSSVCYAIRCENTVCCCGIYNDIITDSRLTPIQIIEPGRFSVQSICIIHSRYTGTPLENLVETAPD